MTDRLLLACFSMTVTALAIGCGDDGTVKPSSSSTDSDAGSGGHSLPARIDSLDELVGYYELSELSARNPDAQFTLTRDDADIDMGQGLQPSKLRGHMTLSASSPTSGAFSLELGVISDDLLMARETTTQMLELEDERLVLTGDKGETVVFRTTTDGPQLVLDKDLDDPRSSDEEGPDRIVLTRRAPPRTELTGSWRVSRLVAQVAAQEEATMTDACFADAEGFSQLDSSLGFTPEGGYASGVTILAFESSDCSDQGTISEDNRTLGFADIDEESSALTLYFRVQHDDPERAAINLDATYELDGNLATLSVTDWIAQSNDDDDFRIRSMTLQRD